MEFNKKLQELRKQRGLTQDALAERLYVSRTAVSKWESGRGYPSIDSLKAIAQFFSITVDELLSSDEILEIAERGQRQTVKHFRDLVFGLVDICAVLLIFLPLFASRSGEDITATSLLSLDNAIPFLKIVYFDVVISLAVTGIATLALQGCKNTVWLRIKSPVSLILGTLAVLIFTLGLHPYAAAFAFMLLAIKVIMLIKYRV